MRKILTIDVGGTFIKYAVMNGIRDFEMSDKGKVPTPRTNHEDFLSALVGIFSAHDDVEGIAVSMPGLIDTHKGICISSGALDFSNGHALAEELRAKCSVPVTVENDANCAALAEVKSGSLVGVRNGFVMVFGTSIGGAFICNGELYRGSNFCAGEIAPTFHSIGEGADGKNVYHYALSFVEFQKKCATILGKDPETVTGEMIFDLFEEGNAEMVNALNRYAHGVATKIFNLQMLFDPERIALGGGISARQSFIDAVQDKLDELSAVSLNYLPHPQIVPCKYRNDANLLGALYRYLGQQEIGRQFR